MADIERVLGAASINITQHEHPLFAHVQYLLTLPPFKDDPPITIPVWLCEAPDLAGVFGQERAGFIFRRNANKLAWDGGIMLHKLLPPAR